MSDELTKEQVVETWSALMIGDGGGLLAKAGHDWDRAGHPAYYERVELVRKSELTALRAQLKEQTKRADKAERIGGNAVAQVAYMVAEINKTFGLNGDRTPADTVQSVREAITMLNERDELRTQVADLAANLAAEKQGRLDDVENLARRFTDDIQHCKQQLAAMTQERDKWIGHAESIGTDRHQIQLAHDALVQQLAEAQATVRDKDLMTADKAQRQACAELLEQLGYRGEESAWPEGWECIMRALKSQRAAEARACAELCDQHHAKDHWYLTKMKEWIMKRAAQWEGK